MPVMEVIDTVEETPTGEHEIPEVEIRGEEAVIHIDTPQGTEERRVKLPKTTWA